MVGFEISLRCDKSVIFDSGFSGITTGISFEAGLSLRFWILLPLNG
jgi:hypothetical protein